MFAPPILKKA